MSERKGRKRRGIMAAAAAGVAVAYFFDPQLGKTRRTRARDRVRASFRHGSRRLGRWGRRTGARGYGAWMKATHPTEQTKDLDDATLAHKIESEVLRTASESITLNAEDGVVVLRGQVGSPERMSELAEAVLRVPGVIGVENLLHLPGEPAPNKAPALEASTRAAESASG
jgi:hypothetical protein